MIKVKKLGIKKLIREKGEENLEKRKRKLD